MGSYLGPLTEAGDRGYADATRRALQLGCNLFDTAINYRHQRSERAIGAGLCAAVDAGEVRRDEFIVCTKGGYIPFDGDEPEDPARYFDETFVRTGAARPEEIAAGCHCMSPSYLRHQIEASLKNLGLETIDVYHLHNPETQLSEIPRPEFESRIADAFAELEKAAASGKIQFYGTATWNGYRVGPREPEHLSLAGLARIAESVGGESHRFRVVQLPYNPAMPEAAQAATQDGRPLLDAAALLKIAVVTSVPLLQTRLFRARLDLDYAGLTTPAQKLIHFARSTPGVLAPLVGMSKVAHVEENLAALGHR
jgi:aryl-alcohol dehydrogenase-like predicted oxidoreductase